MDRSLCEKLRSVRVGEFGAVRTRNQQTAMLCKELGVNTDSNNLYELIADEIERCYIPRPRFEDGEPVQFGDDIEIHNRNGLLDKGIIQSFHPNKGPVWMLSLVGCDHERLVRFDPETCVIKRPTPKVLDADGVEVKRGDRVYPVYRKAYSFADGYIVHHIEVDDGIHSPRVYFILVDSEMGWMPATKLTHDKPVFDADGVRICKGDTVWQKETYERGTVIWPHVSSYPGMAKIDWGTRGACYISPHMLTHREPDSHRKLHADVLDYINENNLGDDDPLVRFANRYSALVKRSAK